ncbi:hypothetical protein ClosIBUN13A_CONTIG167g02567 [Clostridium sp. IBUN13A]|nr:hypothetical protein ClosIBUN22A_CONTIG195g03941 [Clostridium sp. IBUN22A]KJZ92313.1 hypothetical protein ClosIBUN62F_CONTIG56g02078 [Clostridium sp. IBUN62F]KJZ96184.1 hypothetical protein ClosIBUN13A_CONTIG167g02567 [Clostridium sp. IBUN13A]
MLPKIPYEALIFSPSGFKTSVSTKTPPVEFTKASTVPSPPSAIGTFTTSASFLIFFIAFSITSHACVDVMLSLKESVANTNFIIIHSIILFLNNILTNEINIQ